MTDIPTWSRSPWHHKAWTCVCHASVVVSLAFYVLAFRETSCDAVVNQFLAAIMCFFTPSAQIEITGMICALKNSIRLDWQNKATTQCGLMGNEIVYSVHMFTINIFDSCFQCYSTSRVDIEQLQARVNFPIPTHKACFFIFFVASYIFLMTWFDVQDSNDCLWYLQSESF